MTDCKWYSPLENPRYWWCYTNAQKPMAVSVGAITQLSENKYLAVVFCRDKKYDVGVLPTLSAAKQTVEALYPMYMETKL